MTGKVSTAKKLGIVATQRVHELREQHKEPAKYRPVYTPLRDLNIILKGGLPRFPFYAVILGMDKIGKSTMGVQFFIHYCKVTGRKGIIYNLEESSYEAADRAMVIPSLDVSRTNIYTVDFTEQQLDWLEQTAIELQGDEIYVTDELYKIEDIYQDAKDNNCDLILIDNYQLMLGGSGRDTRERLENNSKTIMLHRNQDKITTFLAAQGNTKESSFGSSQPFRDCQFLFEIRYAYQQIEGKKRKGVALEGLREVIVSRARNVGTGSFMSTFEPQYSRLRDCEIKPLDLVKEEAEFEEYEQLDFDEEIQDGSRTEDTEDSD
jgi:replicative DNA helicase